MNKQYAGTGLGLSIVKRIVDLLGGEINVETEESVGTEFIITFPVKNIHKRYSIEINNVIKKHNKLLKIISAEDNEINQKLVEKILSTENENWILKKVYNGKELINELEKDSYDLILMDVLMPEMDGIIATKTIRNDARFKNIKILGLSAYALDMDVKNALEAGMDDYISKPIKKDKLIEKIYKLTDK